MNNTTRSVALTAASLLTLTLAGCINKPTQSESTFGDSVRHMVRSQVDDPATINTPSEDRIDETDGQVLDNVLGVYRGDVSNASDGGSLPNGINVGGTPVGDSQ